MKIDLGSTQNSYPIYGPFTNLGAGRYNIRFKIKLDKKIKDEELFVIDIYKLKTPVYKSVNSDDFKESGKYQYFDLYLDLTQDTDNLEFRIFSKGTGIISVDCVEIWEYTDSI